MPSSTAPPALKSLPWTGDATADRLLVDDPNALLIGFCLDQQITLQHAFLGPLTIRQRLGTLDVARLARMDTDRMRAAFSTPPAIHRFPRSMAERVQRLCAMLAAEYGGDGSRVWREAADARTLERRLTALPGIGPMKARTMINVLGKLLGVRPQG
ncbi:MAG TPA: HhH-GPD-type base excision DNA repair protein, partial [Candidatus Dormibacteraeota bacterium]